LRAATWCNGSSPCCDQRVALIMASARPMRLPPWGRGRSPLSHGITSIIFGFAGNRIGGFYMRAGLHIAYSYHGQLYAIDAWSASTNCVIRNWRDNVNPGRATGQATSTAALPSTSRASVNERLYRAVGVAGLAQLESAPTAPLRFGGVARGPFRALASSGAGRGCCFGANSARGPGYGAILGRQFRVAYSLPPSDLLRGAVPRPWSVPGPSGAGRASTLLGRIRAPGPRCSRCGNPCA
jgi:hypothetical protein